MTQQRPDPRRKRAIATGIVLAAIAVAIYAYVILSYLRHGHG